MQGRCGEGRHVLEIGRLRPATTEGVEGRPRTCGSLVLELEVLVRIRCLTTTTAAFVDPSVERYVHTTSQIDRG